MSDRLPHFLQLSAMRTEADLWVFLPGMDGWGSLFGRQVQELQRHFEVCALRIPAEDRLDWEGLSDRLIDLITAQLPSRVNRQVYLCGESFGGCLALKTALKAPDLISRLILVNPASSFHRRPWMMLGESIVPWVPDRLYNLGSVAVYLLLAALPRIAPHDRQALWSALCDVPAETSAWRLSLLRQFILTPQDVQKITPPTLILASGSDRLLPSISEARHLQHYLPNSQVVYLPHSGHACLLEESISLFNILTDQKWIKVPTVLSP